MISCPEHVLNYLKSNMGGAVQRPGGFEFPASGLSIDVATEKTTISKAGIVVVLNFTITHPHFGLTIHETSAASGETEEAAGIKAANAFIAGVYGLLTEYTSGRRDHKLVTSFFGESKQWAVTEGDIVLMGDSDRTDSYWSHIKKLIPNHLGNRPFYYVKIYAAKQADGNITCECHINNNISRELSKDILPYIASWDNCCFCSQKELLLISQTSAREPYPHTQAEVEEYTRLAVTLFTAVDNDTKYQNLLNDICEITGDFNLACELRTFLPDICAENYFQDASFSDELTLIYGNERLSIYKDQLTSYCWIKNRLLSGFITGEFNDNDYKRLISVSPVFAAYRKAHRNDPSIKNFCVQTAMNVPSGYIVR